MVIRIYRVLGLVVFVALAGWVLAGCAKDENKFFGGVSDYMRCKNEGRC